MMDKKFTEALGAWLSKPAAERDWAEGAEMLLRLNRNRIMYNRVSLDPASRKNREIIEYNLKKFYKGRLADVTHEEVVSMQAEVDVIAKTRHLQTEGSSTSELKKGKRLDHDKLPQEVSSLYVENLSILQEMRALHTQLRIMSDDTSRHYCPDSDRYPLLKRLIELDKKYRSNWQAYDTYNVNGEQSADEDLRAMSSKYQRLVNLNKGKYAKNPNETLAAQIKDWYAKIINPPAKLTSDLEDLGIL